MQHYALLKFKELDSVGISAPRRGCCSILTNNCVDIKIAALRQRLPVAR